MSKVIISFGMAFPVLAMSFCGSATNVQQTRLQALTVPGIDIGFCCIFNLMN